MTPSRLEIDLTDYREIDSKGSSKGIQSKYTNGKLWVKLNYLGYEDLSEYYASKLLECSNYKNFVKYYLCTCNGKEGCYSENMLKPGEVLYSVGRILQLEGILQEHLIQMDSIEKRVKTTIDAVLDLTGLDLTDYLATLLTFDAIILNEDRHLFNIALILDTTTNKFRPAPIFDNGLSFLSDLRDYPFDELTMKHIRHVKSKPFCPNFKKQMSLFTKSPIKFDNGLVNELLAELGEESRIRTVIEYARYTYPEYFTNLQSKSDIGVLEWNSK